MLATRTVRRAPQSPFASPRAPLGLERSLRISVDSAAARHRLPVRPGIPQTARRMSTQASPQRSEQPRKGWIKLAVNGTLMRGLELNDHLTEVHAEFLREDQTVPIYRLFSINDRHPAMVRVPKGGVSVAVEVWHLSPKALVHVMETEPPGLCIGKVDLVSGEQTFGVLGEPFLLEGQKDITQYKGWRAYVGQVLMHAEN